MNIRHIDGMKGLDETTSFAYHIDGQLAERKGSDSRESFYWDGLALVKRGETSYINDPAVTGGNPILADDDVLFNDMLGATLGTYGKEFKEINRTTFGSGSEKGFFTGKPYVKELGAVFLFRNYRPELGKWQTSDPLGYPDGWNNFAYVNNWVISCIDRLGTDIYHVNASGAVSGVGHSGAIVGNSQSGYRIINHGGGNTDPNVVHSWNNTYNSVSEALNTLNAGRTGDEAFDRIQRWETSSAQDDIAYTAMLNAASETYNPLTNNCWQAVQVGVEQVFAFSSLYVSDTIIPNHAFAMNGLKLFGPTTLDFQDVLNGVAE
jgi:RHS repeat-associated protein